MNRIQERAQKFKEEEQKKKSMIVEIGKRIKAARDEASMSQLQVGISLGVSDKTISGYESGRISPPIDKIIQLGDLFKRPTSYFLGADPKEYKVASRLRAVEMILKEVKKQLNELKIVAQSIDLDK